MTYDGKLLKEEIIALANNLNQETIELRRSLHQFPELSWKEENTASLLRELLDKENLEVKSGICGTGLTAESKGGKDGKTIAVRADMDALPMHDQKEVPYASRVPGVMHACGHDCHMAVAVGVAKVLNRVGVEFPGKVRFIFQPCEEATPSGAKEMTQAGVMKEVDSIVAFHVDPEIYAGKIGLRAGILTAKAAEFRLSIFGKSGHAARPHQSIDTIFLSNQVLNALYDVVGNRSQAFIPAVLTIGKISGGTKANVIPERVDIAGTVRTIDEQTSQQVIFDIEEKVHALTRAAGGSYQLEFPSPIPSVNNDLGLVNLAREVGTFLLAKDKIVDIENVSMGGEDFSWYLEKTPGALIRLGVRRPAGEVLHLHTHRFDVDERALSLGICLMSMFVLKYLLEDNLRLS